MSVIRHADARRTVTPNATMTTHASPTQGGSDALAVWTAEIAPGAVGPVHTFDVDQVWTVLAGAARVELDGETHDVGPGDTVVMPAGRSRQVHADPGSGFTAVVAAQAGAQARVPGGDPVLPDWIA